MKRVIISVFVLIPAIMLLAIFVIMSAGEQKVMAAVTGPCDIYASGGTPCVAAHSTVRALYGSYGGNLYQVRRTSDNTTKDIPVLTTGGYANSSVQDSFCSGTTCTISIIYDQSGKGNHLRVAPNGGAGSGDTEAVATNERLTVGGNYVYSCYTNAKQGYRNNSTNGIAKNDEPESLYMVTSGKHFNGACCYDYGNAETNNQDTGNGHMETIYFGNCNWWGEGSGNGPWVMADLENGVFAGQTATTNTNNTPITSTYVTAIVKGKPGTFCIKGGDANSGTLKTMWEGGRPTATGYNPMHKEGAIILGIGGDNSNGSAGTFYEGAITTGYASDATDNAIQENIIAAGYGSGSTAVPTSVPTEGPTAGPTGVINGSISIACGSSSDVGSFQPDQYYSGGSTFNNTNTVDVSQITSNPPPAELFNNERYGAMSYTIPGFTAGGTYDVLLYFAETYLTSSGSRVFNVSSNGTAVLSNFDIYSSAGGQNKAIARSFTTTADGSGQIVIQFTAVTENPKVNGISINPGSNNGTLGDVNGSGTIDIVDALLIAQYYVGLNPSNFNSSVADVNCSGGVDIVDALIVAQYYVGLISGFPC
jgi:hypothetical protein